MSVRVKMPVILQRLTEGKIYLEAKAGTIKDILEELVFQYPDIEKKIFDDNKKIRSYIKLIYISNQNEQAVVEHKKFLQSSDRVNDGGVIRMLMPIAGG